MLPEVEDTCGRIIVIHQGKIVADGTTEELIARARGLRTIVVEAAGTGVGDALTALAGVEEVSGAEERDGRIRMTLRVSSDSDLRPEIFELAKSRDWVLWELHEEMAGLEDLFGQLTR